MRPWIVLPLFATLLLTGCGGGTLFGSNSNIAVIASNPSQKGVELVVAPTQGRESDTAACTAASDGFGCAREINDLFITYRFQTNSLASQEPFFVYLRNTSESPRNVTLDIRVDNKQKVTESLLLLPKSTTLAAKIYRNNAESTIRP